MVFGPVKGSPCGHRRPNIFCSVLLPIAVAVDVKPFFGYVVPKLASWVVVVPNDLTPFLFNTVALA